MFLAMSPESECGIILPRCRLDPFELRKAPPGLHSPPSTEVASAGNSPECGEINSPREVVCMYTLLGETGVGRNINISQLEV